MIAIAPLEWPGMNQAFLTALIATLVLSLAIIPYGKRRSVGAPFSWGEAMLASTYIFGVLFLAFGILPHQWIDHADKDLGWSKDKIIYGPGGILKPESAGGWNPITLQYEAVRDIVASAFQSAGKEPEEVGDEEEGIPPTSFVVVLLL